MPSPHADFVSRFRRGTMRASAMPVNTDLLLGDVAYRRRVEEWQQKVFRFGDTIPEVMSASRYVENSLGRVGWEAGKVDGDDVAPAPDSEAAKLIKSLRTLDAGRLANNLFTVGEAYAVVSQPIGGKGGSWWNPIGVERFWRSASISELVQDKQNERKYTFKPSASSGLSGSPSEYPMDNSKQTIIRIWSPDRQFSSDATSAHKALLTVLESLSLHTIADQAYALSVVAGAGILYIPNDDFLPEIEDPSAAPVPGTQRHFDEHMNDQMTIAMNDRASSAAVVPIKIYGRAEYADGLRHLLLERADNAIAFKNRMETYRQRYAGGIDLPAEIVLGLGDANHWTAWKVDQNTWTYHLAPLAQLMADALTEGWLIPSLKQMGVKDAEDYVIVPNGRKVVEKADNTTTILDLSKQGLIDQQAVIEALDLPREWIGRTSDTSDGGGNGGDVSGHKDMPSGTNVDTKPSVRPQTGGQG